MMGGYGNTVSYQTAYSKARSMIIASFNFLVGSSKDFNICITIPKHEISSTQKTFFVGTDYGSSFYTHAEITIDSSNVFSLILQVNGTPRSDYTVRYYYD